MSEYIIGKILSYAKDLHIFRPLSLIIIISTGPFAGILTFHLHKFFKNLFINLPPIKFPLLGDILGREYDLIPALTEGAIGLIIWLLLFLSIRKFLDYLIKPYLVWISKRQKKYMINFTKTTSTVFGRSWIIQGSPLINQRGLIFTNSNSGCLIKPASSLKFWKTFKMWKDFEAEIEVDFTRIWSKENAENKEDGVKAETFGWKEIRREFRQVLGIVFRAQSLEDYFMIEVWKVGKTLSFRPHVRMSGNWDAPVHNSPQVVNLQRNDHLINLKLKVENNDATLSIVGKGKLEWTLPSEYETNLIQHQSFGEKEGLKKGAVNNIQFRNKVGMFGFRNYGNEIAVVKSLSIRPL